MKLITRLSATIGAGASRAVTRFENHEAIASAAVREARERVAAARVGLAGLRRDGDERRTALAALESEEARWEARARASAAHDERDALACLERRRATRVRLEEARRALARHAALEREGGARLQSLETRLTELSGRRDALRTRAALARATEVLDTLERGGDGLSGDGLSDVFDRWEIRLAGRESAELRETSAERGSTIRPDDDPLERRHADAEHEASLRAELALLRGEASAATKEEGR